MSRAEFLSFIALAAGVTLFSLWCAFRFPVFGYQFVGASLLGLASLSIAARVYVTSKPEEL